MLYQNEALVMYKHRATKLKSEAGESDAAFRARVRQASVEKRDLAVEKVRTRYEKKFDRAQEKIRKAKDKLGVQEEQLDAASGTSWLDGATSVFGSLFGRRKVSTAVRSFGSKRARVKREKADVKRAESDLRAAEDALKALEAELTSTLDDIEPVPPATEIVVRPRKGDFDLSPITVVWTPEV